jgi:hypothetical protein
VKLTPNATLLQVARDVAIALEKAGIRAVLTGGACAALHTAGEYQSDDLDFILQSAPTQSALDKAMAGAGFRRKRDLYFHPNTPFFVEFPPGPLGIGRDLSVKPIQKQLPRGLSKIRTLSATDSCRDRLAAFYHWNDRQSLRAAVKIARRNAVDLAKIRSWSRQEKAEEGYREFARELARGRVKKARAS